MDIINCIMRFENGEMEDKEIVTLFQKLIDTGIIYSLQGTYQRIAENLIKAGLCENR